MDNYNNTSSNSLTNTYNNSTKTLNDYIELLPQSYLIVSILTLFIILFLMLVITLGCLLKRRKKRVNGNNLFNNIGVHKIVIKNPNNEEKIKNENINDFQAVQNNSNVGETIQQNMTLGGIKEKNLKEEVHNIISGTLTELSLNKSKKFAQRKKGSSSRRNRIESEKLTNNNIIFSPKEFAEDKKYGTNIIV